MLAERNYKVTQTPDNWRISWSGETMAAEEIQATERLQQYFDLAGVR